MILSLVYVPMRRILFIFVLQRLNIIMGCSDESSSLFSLCPHHLLLFCISPIKTWLELLKVSLISKLQTLVLRSPGPLSGALLWKQMTTHQDFILSVVRVRTKVRFKVVISIVRVIAIW